MRVCEEGEEEEAEGATTTSSSSMCASQRKDRKEEEGRRGIDAKGNVDRKEGKRWSHFQVGLNDGEKERALFNAGGIRMSKVQQIRSSKDKPRFEQSLFFSLFLTFFRDCSAGERHKM